MAASGAERRPRRGPAPIASFDHDVSEEVSSAICSSPENKQVFRLPEIREDPASSTTSVTASTSGGVDCLAPPEQRARSHSSPAVHEAATVPTVSGLQTPAAPRIDISRASSSSHHDSRDSSPELALFAGSGGGEDARARLELGFREDGTADLRSSTEELAFLEGAPGGAETRTQSIAPPSRRHSRKDSQGSEAALLGVSGRTSRLSSVGSQCSAHSALSGFSHTSRVSRLSVVSGISRSPSPHKMLLETSFCGPKPIETDPEICAAVVEERLLEIAKLTNEAVTSIPEPKRPPDQIDSRDHREVRTEATVENTRPASAPRLTSPNAPSNTPVPGPAPSSSSLDDEKRLKETMNRAKVEERRARPKERREPSKPEALRRGNQSKDIIRIKLKPDDEYEDDNEEESERTLFSGEPARKPITLELNDRPTCSIEPISPQTTSKRTRDSRTPSPCGVAVSRKSSFCSLFKSRETIASPDSPSDALRRKKSLNEGRSRSKSRDRSSTPTSAGKIKGSVLSLFKTPRRSGTSPSPGSRDASPVVQQQRQFPQPVVDRPRGEKLKYYEDSKDGIIHIPLRTPPDELNSTENTIEKPQSRETVTRTEPTRPASAPQQRPPLERNAVVTSATPTSLPKRTTQRTVLPDGSIIIPLHSPTEKTANVEIPSKTESKRESGMVKEVEQSTRKTEQEFTPDKSLNSVSKPSFNSGHTNNASSEEIISAGNGAERPRRKERIIFTTHVGSKEQVFSTQFSITKTPSVASEISESIPSFPESEEVRPSESPQRVASLKNIVNDITPEIVDSQVMFGEIGEEIPRDAFPSPPPDTGRDSSESDASSEVATTHGGSEAERRGLVVQESFEELPYVPTTLPLERSLALPMVPVRERGGVTVAAVRRPRAPRGAASALGALTPPAGARGAAPSALTPPAGARGAAPSALTPPSAAPGAERLHIRLPRRARAASTASDAPAPPPRTERARSRSGGDAGSEARSKSEWIDFSELPERRKQPKRIQTLPATARDAVVFSYVPPERCRCECHAHAHAPDDERPLLARREPAHSPARSPAHAPAHSPTSPVSPFTADFDLQDLLDYNDSKDD
ncbi:serine/arginine repetitive matrix protein 1 [Melitaea cinxia]|uniref:serine/arginine repetitive matrix protein 1 n=1 Tax=Melitaea cinxia TaxID=113334 RepID=UPI001E271CD8|nr:serine/arginine repetitive matrix protein 1 [Melitaea cinxia]